MIGKEDVTDLHRFFEYCKFYSFLNLDVNVGWLIRQNWCVTFVLSLPFSSYYVKIPKGCGGAHGSLSLAYSLGDSAYAS